MKREMALIIGYALCSALGATVLSAVFMAVVSAVETYKKQRNLPAYESHSATNPEPFDRRRRPILHVSDHIEKLIDEKE
jgi:hypothetical protein